MAVREKTILIRARHASRLDRNQKPIEKIFTEAAWNSLHDDNWIEVSSSHPKVAAVKTKPAAQKIVKVKQVRAAKKAAPKKPAQTKAKAKRK